MWLQIVQSVLNLPFSDAPTVALGYVTVNTVVSSNTTIAVICIFLKNGKMVVLCQLCSWMLKFLLTITAQLNIKTKWLSSASKVIIIVQSIAICRENVYHWFCNKNVYPGYHSGIGISFCGCKTKIERLVELRLWPATPQSPHVAFTMDLLDIVHATMLECQASLHHISGMLQFVSTIEMVSKLPCVTFCL